MWWSGDGHVTGQDVTLSIMAVYKSEPRSCFLKLVC